MSEHHTPTQELLDQLRLEEIERARKMSTTQKLEASGDLFDMACEVTLSGIKAQCPGISEIQALEVLRKRLAVARMREFRL